MDTKGGYTLPACTRKMNLLLNLLLRKRDL